MGYQPETKIEGIVEGSQGLCPYILITYKSGMRPISFLTKGIPAMF